MNEMEQAKQALRSLGYSPDMTESMSEETVKQLALAETRAERIKIIDTFLSEKKSTIGGDDEHDKP